MTETKNFSEVPFVSSDHKIESLGKTAKKSLSRVEIDKNKLPQELENFSSKNFVVKKIEEDVPTDPLSLAKTLRDRYEYIKGRFEKKLPEVVLQTDYVVANTYYNGKPDVFEVQEEISNFIDMCPSHGELDSEDFLNMLRTQICERFDKEFVAHIKKDLLIFFEEMEEVIEQDGRIIDIEGSANLVVSEKGLTLIDADYCEVDEQQKWRIDKAQLRIKKLKKFAQSL